MVWAADHVNPAGPSSPGEDAETVSHRDVLFLIANTSAFLEVPLKSAGSAASYGDVVAGSPKIPAAICAP